MCVCSLSYPAYKKHAPYYIVIGGMSRSTIYFHIYLTNGAIFGEKKVIEHKMFVLSETFSILRRIQVHTVTNVHRS